MNCRYEQRDNVYVCQVCGDVSNKMVHRNCPAASAGQLLDEPKLLEHQEAFARLKRAKATSSHHSPAFPPTGVAKRKRKCNCGNQKAALERIREARRRA
jgi:predicted ATP-dependent serine protease